MFIQQAFHGEGDAGLFAAFEGNASIGSSVGTSLRRILGQEPRNFLTKSPLKIRMLEFLVLTTLRKPG